MIGHRLLALGLGALALVIVWAGDGRLPESGRDWLTIGRVP